MAKVYRIRRMNGRNVVCEERKKYKGGYQWHALAFCGTLPDLARWMLKDFPKAERFSIPVRSIGETIERMEQEHRRGVDAVVKLLENAAVDSGGTLTFEVEK